MNRYPKLRGMTRLFAIIIACCLVATACGADGDSTAGTDDDQVLVIPSETENDETPEPEPEVDDEDEPTTDARNDGDIDAFCTAAENVDGSLDLLGDGPIPTPEELETQFNELEKAMAEAVKLAPDKIRPDVEKSAEAFGILVDAFADADYSFFDIDLSALDRVDSDPAYSEASDNMDLFLFTDCGIGTDPRLDPEFGDEPDDDPVFEGTVREQIEDELIEIGLTAAEASCIAEKIDPATFSLEDPNVMVALFEACNISLERLAELGG